MGRAWIAALGTPLDGPGWTEIGTLDHDGLVYEVGEPLVESELPLMPLRPITITLRMRGRFPWRFYRQFFGTPGPHASRVKREYHRRRR